MLNGGMRLLRFFQTLLVKIGEWVAWMVVSSYLGEVNK